MTTPARAEIEMGQLGLALVMEDFRRRIESKAMTEADVAELMTAALGRFPPEFEPRLREFLASHAPPGA